MHRFILPHSLSVRVVYFLQQTPRNSSVSGILHQNTVVTWPSTQTLVPSVRGSSLASQSKALLQHTKTVG